MDVLYYLCFIISFSFIFLFGNKEKFLVLEARVLKDEILGKNYLPVTVIQVKSSNPIKIVKGDAHSVRIVST